MTHLPCETTAVRFERVLLRASQNRLSDLSSFYGSLAEAVEFSVGEGDPFYHFALLVPGDRFAAAHEWARGEFELLPDSDTGNVVFDFENWDARAIYFHDPIGNIVELIAHRGVEENGHSGAFDAGELCGVSELGLVGDRPALARRLAEELELEVWAGSVDEPHRLAFVGEKARTFVLSPPGRGWLPTGRPAVAHPAVVVVDGITLSI